MLASLGAELLKLRKRPSTWVLGLIWLSVIVLLNYTLVYVLLSSIPPPAAPEDTPRAQQEQLQKQQEQFQEEQLRSLYPENLPALISNFPSVGAPIALILGALTVGSEYGWATLKTVLTQRPGRSTVFLGKLLALGVVLALLAVLVFVAGAVSSYVVAGLSGGSLGGPPLGALIRALGAGGLILAAWAALGAFLATLLRSTALSVGIGLVYSLGLETLVSNLPIPNKTFTNVIEFLPGQNSTFLADSFSGQAPAGFASQSPPVDATQATLVLLVYTAVFILLATFVFGRRDVN